MDDICIDKCCNSHSFTCGVFIVIMMNLNKMADNIEKDVEIKVIVDLAADKAAIAGLEEKIRSTDGVLDVKYSSNEEELDKMIKDFGDEFGLYKQDNPLRHAFYVKATDPQQTAIVAKKIESYEYVYEVVYGEGKVEKLFNVLNTESKRWPCSNRCTSIYSNVLNLKYDSYYDCCKKKRN